MKYNVHLQSSASTTFRCQKAANSLDINVDKKLTHELSIDANLGTYTVGVILGASGSGKTTLARQMFGTEFENVHFDESKPVLDQFPEEWTYDQCAEALSGIGLTSVPTWIRPLQTLSNGQRTRAIAALQLAIAKDEIVIDEFTSVVDRTVAKAMSYCVQKYARRVNKRVVLLACHYDVVEWLDPDWVIDCNTGKFIDRRLLHPTERKRKERLLFHVRPCSRDTWPSFSKYHYLSDRLAGGLAYYYGLYDGPNQIGFQAFSNYVPRRQKGDSALIVHSNRTVVHPDYCGLGLGVRLINAGSWLMHEKGHTVMGVFSSIPVFRAFKSSPCWLHLGSTLTLKADYSGTMQRVKSLRKRVEIHSFQFIPSRFQPERDGIEYVNFPQVW